MVASAMILRALGVNMFGNFSFVNNVLTQLITFLDLKTSTYFFVRLSRRHEETGVIRFYAIHVLLIVIVLALVVVVISTTGLYSFAFAGIPRVILWLSLAFVVVKFISELLVRMSDAY